jgi:hypothetical protein
VVGCNQCQSLGMSLPQDSSGTCPEGFEVQTNPFRSRAGTTPDIERFRAFYIPGTLQQLLICARGECSVDNALILPQAFRTLSPRVPSSSGVHMLSDSRRKPIIASSANFSHRRIKKSPQNRGLDLAMSKRTAGLPPKDLTTVCRCLKGSISIGIVDPRSLFGGFESRTTP